MQIAAAQTVKQVIGDNCKSRRDKLLHTGLAYDLANAKGHVMESETETAQRELSFERIRLKDRKATKVALVRIKKDKKLLEAAKKQRARSKYARTERRAATKKERVENKKRM